MFKKNGKGQSLGIVKVAVEETEIVPKEAEQKPEEKIQAAPVKGN